jgi:hypothetical protein
VKVTQPGVRGMCQTGILLNAWILRKEAGTVSQECDHVQHCRHLAVRISPLVYQNLSVLTVKQISRRSLNFL